MSQNEIAISVQGLKKSYKNIPVLTGVDIQVKAGSIFALLGSNGAGKTASFSFNQVSYYRVFNFRMRNQFFLTAVPE